MTGGARSIIHCAGFLIAWLWSGALSADEVSTLNDKADGFRGIWYMNQRLKSEYRFKYSGGLGTYCAKHQPFAVHCPDVKRTYFCYGGVPERYHERPELKAPNYDRASPEGALLHMVSYYDHQAGMLARPTLLLDKRTHDAHDNPVLTVDGEGHIWIFSTAHGSMRPAFVHKSDKPHDIDSFTRVQPYRGMGETRQPITNFSYMQAWHVPKRGFAYFFTKYDGWRRETCFASSRDGLHWENWTQLADIEEGHYQISAVNAVKVACAFNYHPKAFQGEAARKGLNWRTNLYYMESENFGQSWQAADGTELQPPLKGAANPALVKNYEEEGLLVYLKDIVFDAANRPIILFVTSRGYESGPVSGPRTWRMARWTGKGWKIHEITTSDSNYDMGSIHVEQDALRVVAPTEEGPQPHNPGGEVAMWVSQDHGKTWAKQAQLTSGSEYNHSYVRRPFNAHPDFYGFWADGHGREPSSSRLYYCNRNGEVFMMPEKMSGDQAEPFPIHPAQPEN